MYIKEVEPARVVRESVVAIAGYLYDRDGKVIKGYRLYAQIDQYGYTICQRWLKK